MKIAAVLVATAAGLAAGWLCGQVPVWPVVRAIAATIFGCMIGVVAGLAATLFAMMTHSRSAGIGAVSVGLAVGPFVLGIFVLALAALAGQLIFQRLGIGMYGPVILGGASALIVALWFS